MRQYQFLPTAQAMPTIQTAAGATLKMAHNKTGFMKHRAAKPMVSNATKGAGISTETMARSPHSSSDVGGLGDERQHRREGEAESQDQHACRSEGYGEHLDGFPP
ncbi:hypothetical protein [Novosphingobium sp. HR1a]|uniref:hypothetical protein n=1 Tax=Novosphingobium sp. HR1a TaxID=1395637 RepID=UPI001B3C8218|nr:hypothetical protein [Novosphingobium sp. HR1a]MBF7015711.1 hypothetical protein [Novosphingobium sp. HR1a]MCC4254675.1 hypothetical protein [Sphingobium naphthae]